MKEVYLRFDSVSGRWLLEDWELHCGDCFEVRVEGVWVGTRIEYSSGWYLVGVTGGESTRNMGNFLARRAPR